MPIDFVADDEEQKPGISFTPDDPEPEVFDYPAMLRQNALLQPSMAQASHALDIPGSAPYLAGRGEEPGLLGTLWEGATEPLAKVGTGALNLGAKLAWKATGMENVLPEAPTISDIAHDPTTDKTTKIVAGASEALGQFGDFFTSPLGIATLGIGALPAAAQKAIAGAFAVHMGSQTPELARELGAELGKPEEERDYGKISNLMTTAGANTFFTAAGGLHATPKRVRDIPLTPGDNFRLLGRDIAERPMDIPETDPLALRRPGVSMVDIATPDVIRPELKDIAGAAITEAQGPTIRAPGQEPSLLRLRRELNPELITTEMITPKQDPGGGRISFASPAEALAIPSARQAAVEFPAGPRSPYAVEPQAAPPIRTVRNQPAERAREVPTEGTGKAPNVGGSKAPAVEGPKTSESVSTFARELDSPSATKVDNIQSQKAGLGAKTVEDLDALASMYDSQRSKTSEFLKTLEKLPAEERFRRYGEVPDRSQLAREAIEVATNTGSWIEGEGVVKTAMGERPMDWSKNPQVRDWLIKNAERIWGNNPDSLRVNLELLQSKKGGVANEPGRVAPKETRTDEAVLTVDEVTPLEPASGAPLTGIEALINKLEALRLPERGTGNLYTLPHPDAISAIGRGIWNNSIDVVIGALKAGKSAKDAVTAAIDYVRKNAKGFNETELRNNLNYIVERESPRGATTPAPKPGTQTPPVKTVTAEAAKQMESRVKLASDIDVGKIQEQLNLFNQEIGAALESGGRFLPKDMRPDVAKGAPAEGGTMTNAKINQYFVNKLSTIRKQFNDFMGNIAREGDPVSQQYAKLLRERFELAFRQVQELRRASHESLFFWNKIKAEYQEIAKAAGQMPEIKKQIPILDQIWKDFRNKDFVNAGKHMVDYLRMNLFTLGSWTLDFGTNLVSTATKLPAWAILDAGNLIAGNPAQRMGSALRALQDNAKNMNPFGKRFRLNDEIEARLGNTAGAEFGGRGKEVMVDFSEILSGRPELASKLKHIDLVLGAPVRMKRAVDNLFGRFGASVELYNRAYTEGRKAKLNGDELKQFVERYVNNPPPEVVDQAVKTGKELKFNRDLSSIEERIASNTAVKLIAEAFPRWTFQFARWGAEMIGADPAFAKAVLTRKATPEQVVNYLTKAATGWGGIYMFNQLFYDDIDANTMEYVAENGDRVRLSGRTPAPELYMISAMLRGDTDKAKAALAHVSIPGAKLLSGEPAGILSPLIDTVRESMRGRYTADQTAREMTKIVNDAIPGKSTLGMIRAIYDPTIREGIGANIPGISSLLPQKVNPTTGEPSAPKQKIPGTGIEIPTVAGTPFPGAARVLNEIEKELMNHGIAPARPRRTSIIDLPAEDVPKERRREFEQIAGKLVQEILSEGIRLDEYKELPFEVRREVLQKWIAAARTAAKAQLAEKYGSSGASAESTPLNIKRMPERLTK